MKRIYINQSVCIGCRLCEVYCKVAHSKSADLVKAFTRESPRPEALLRVEERRPVCFPVQCRHCEYPMCVYACLTGALRQDPASGVVTVDTEKCFGCWTCILVCPSGAIKRDTRQQKIIKCDLCTGRDMPACVANCPNGALVYAEDQSEAANNKPINCGAQEGD